MDAPEYVQASDCRRLHANLAQQLEHLAERLEHVCNGVEALDKRLYRDNGRPSIQTRLDRVETVLCQLTALHLPETLAWNQRVINAGLWLAGLSCAFAVLTVLGLIAQHILGVDAAVLPSPNDMP